MAGNSRSNLRIAGPLDMIQDVLRPPEHEMGVLTTSLECDECLSDRD